MVIMIFKENLKNKIKLDRLLQSLLSTIREVPENHWVDKELMLELLEMTDFESEKMRDLELYVRPLEGAIMEVLVLDNELPIYHATVDDVAMRKSPRRGEMYKIGNIKKILFDRDVVESRGKESLKRIHAIGLSLLDLRYTGDDLAVLIEDAREGLEHKSITRIEESLDLFFELLDFQALSIEEPAMDLHLFAGRGPNGNLDKTYEHLILFDEDTLSMSLKKGIFSLQRDSDLDWVRRYSLGEKQADLQGIDVFEFLSELALERTNNLRKNKIQPA
jgi:hypothetical protein